MGLFNVKASGYAPKENQEFGNKKKLVGDAVCQVTLDKIVSKKNGKEWLVLKGEVIHTIADPKDRPTTLEPSDSIDKIYDPTNDESIQELNDDLFTAGISYENGTDDDSTFANIKAATDGKLVYYRTWAKDKTKEQIAQKPDAVSYWQNIKILSVNKITPENSTPQVAF